MIANLSERIQLARARGGRAATGYWLANRLLRIETYKFNARTLPADDVKIDPSLPEGYAYLCVNSKEVMEQCDPAVIDGLERNNGVSVAETIERGGRIYAIVRGNQVATQQRVEFGRSYTTSPYPMDLYLGEGEAFFSFLYTLPAERGRGLALKLSAHILNDLTREGVTRCISHTRGTNVGSLATRKRAGWKLVALLYGFRPAKRGYFRRLPAWDEVGCTLQAVRVGDERSPTSHARVA